MIDLGERRGDGGQVRYCVEREFKKERERGSGLQRARQDRVRETGLHLSRCDLFLTSCPLADHGKGLEKVNYNLTVRGRRGRIKAGRKPLPINMFAVESLQTKTTV